MPSSSVGIDNNTYYPSGNIIVAPSSNSVDSGKLYTEYNGRRITINITDANYVIAPNPGGYDVIKQDEGVFIQSGEAEIDGFAVYTKEGVSYRLPTTDEIVNNEECYYNGYALLCLHTIFDAQENLCGNVMVDSEWYCTGIRVEYVSYEDYKNKPAEYLLLAGVKEDGTVKINKDKYTRIDAKYILVKVEGDPETGVPPTQTTDLLTFINNFLHGYWVSKAGDNEYGELLFKTAPDEYFKEGFDYKTEDSLNSSRFGVKISKSGSTFVIKPETEVATNIVNQSLPGIIGFYEGFYKGDKNTEFEEYIQASANKLDSSIYNTTNLLELVVDNGVIRLKSKNAQGPVLSIESNKATHNGVEVGTVIYANNSGSDIEDFDLQTKYNSTINYLVDAQGRIKTVDASNISRDIFLDTINNSINIEEPDITNTKRPTVNLQAGTLYGIIKLGTQNIDKDSNNSSAWTNVLELSDNIKIQSEKNTDNLGSIQAEGFIVAGKYSNPATIQVPDIANSGGNRTLKSGDIYGSQIWSAVYNDVTEIFQIHIEDKNKIKPGMILAVDNNNPDYYVLADENNDTIVGVVSENPAFCCGGKDVECGVPVALAGRVKVILDDKSYKPQIGCYIKQSMFTPGLGTSTLNVGKDSWNDQYVGKVIKIIDKNTVEILVTLV